MGFHDSAMINRQRLGRQGWAAHIFREAILKGRLLEGVLCHPHLQGLSQCLERAGDTVDL
jgi:hypothetical protein